MLEALFQPRSVAVIGASPKPLSIGHRVLMNLQEHQFQGPIYPVHPRHQEIAGLAVYPSVLAIDGPVDLAMIAIPAARVAQAIKECGRKGVKCAIVHSAGFRESGAAGEAREQAILQLARSYGLRLYGPNAQGVINSDPAVRLYANFTFSPMRPGHISILAQSGGIGEMLNMRLAEKGVGVRWYASNGNAADISLDELLAYFGQDAQTRVILLYLESFPDPLRFVRTAAAITPHKPILAIKAGCSRAGARAAACHTGALREPEQLSTALFAQSGVLGFERQEELLASALAFAAAPVPTGGQVAIITNAGGPAIQATDEAVRHGLTLSVLGPSTRQALQEQLPPAASLTNPVDLTATATAAQFAHTLQVLLQEPQVHGLLLNLVTPFFVDNEAIAAVLVQALAKCDRPALVTYLTDKNRWGHLLEQLRTAGIAVYDYPENAALALAALYHYGQRRQRADDQPISFACESTKAAELLARVPRDEQGLISWWDAWPLLRYYQLPAVPSTHYASLEELQAHAEKLEYPVVLKAVRPGLVHKTEAGAVKLELGNRTQLDQAAEQMSRELGPDLSFVVQPYLRAAHALIMGFERIQGAALIMVGMGGIFAEIMRDTQWRLAPLTPTDAQQMLRSLRGYQILAGARGTTAVDFPTLVNMLLKLSQLAMEQPQITVLDLNPVLATGGPDCAWVVDLRVQTAASR